MKLLTIFVIWITLWSCSYENLEVQTRGILIDLWNNPVSNKAIKCYHSQDGSFTTSETDGKGQFIFTELDHSGTYRIQVAKHSIVKGNFVFAGGVKNLGAIQIVQTPKAEGIYLHSDGIPHKVSQLTDVQFKKISWAKVPFIKTNQLKNIFSPSLSKNKIFLAVSSKVIPDNYKFVNLVLSPFDAKTTFIGYKIKETYAELSQLPLKKFGTLIYQVPSWSVYQIKMAGDFALVSEEHDKTFLLRIAP